MDDFVNYYELMQISPRAETATIRRVYRMLAARYHPDNQETGDVEMFLLLEQAFGVLNDAEQRSAYDTRLAAQELRPDPVFELKDFVVGIEAEANRRLGVLCLLYNRRRSTPDQPGLSLLDLETRTNIPREYLDFTVWYLREKRFVRSDESTNDLILTAAGADFVESQSRDSGIVRKLLRPAQWNGRAGEDSGLARAAMPSNGAGASSRPV